MSIRFSLLAAFLLLASDAQAQTSRLFLVPTARPAERVEVGARLVVPSVEANLGRGVSAGVTGLVLPRKADGVNAGGVAGGGAVDLRVTLVNRETSALALGATTGASYSSGDRPRHLPFSSQVYAVGTLGGAEASVSAGVGVRVKGQNEWESAWPGCPECDSGFGRTTYRVRVEPLPYLFGGAEAELARVGPLGYRVMAEGLAMPDGGDYSTLALGGLRVTHRRVTLDLGGAAATEWEQGERETHLGPWVALSAGF